MKHLNIDGIVVLVGENAKENHDLLDMDIVDGDHIWMHHRDNPSAHVIVCSETVHRTVLEKAAVYCIRKTNGRKTKDYVIWARVRDVTKCKTKGQVKVSTSTEMFVK